MCERVFECGALGCTHACKHAYECGESRDTTAEA